MSITNKVIEISKYKPKKNQLLMAKVLSEEPLEIEIIGDKKRIITKDLIIKSKHLTDYVVMADIENDSDAEIELEKIFCTPAPIPCTGLNHNHGTIDKIGITDFQLTVKNHLEVDDIIMCLSFDYGNKYYILDRVV